MTPQLQFFTALVLSAACLSFPAACVRWLKLDPDTVVKLAETISTAIFYFGVFCLLLWWGMS